MLHVQRGRQQVKRERLGQMKATLELHTHLQLLNYQLHWLSAPPPPVVTLAAEMVMVARRASTGQHHLHRRPLRYHPMRGQRAASLLSLGYTSTADDIALSISTRHGGARELASRQSTHLPSFLVF